MNAFAFFVSGKAMVTIMLKEGQVRIPSGCAIAAVIAKDGERMSGRPIIEAMKPMHDRSNGLAVALPLTASIRNTRICTLFIFSLTSVQREKIAKYS